ncbi:hypothetical protein [Kitasatospora cathayae]|uniref:Uncharacterized protein n=1 Tax=Kitasatospora cathayae TaxID=3004092 RepID=A0ABY7Q9Y1_9ACTN|nr:hypothetical protein [Kitasatospora sp. HUAS 3-15]WBP89550.1 hypothetical protein O1G21_29375 [Kitasatospora sp. HUAS 3-15]
MPKPLPLPADLLPLHVAVVEADRAMTTTREAGGDVDAARDTYIDRALTLRAHPIWEEARAAACYAQTWQASLDAAKAYIDGEPAAA